MCDIKRQQKKNSLVDVLYQRQTKLHLLDVCYQSLNVKHQPYFGAVT